ncbi:hypothetical protein MTR67_025125 [Solanum verrucosum]|uniref:Uncharacterized protein n=1 Tax=Solanum verrucosum TaxID=315347 RepID=A0AAF0R2Z0_SOLVR|nr:hypothetical protein MTR67_025125 [Solanum verrucosum]
MSEIESADELQRREFEEALEVKSLRRIISAYLNYPEAAEEDVKRWERSLTKLPPHHKALLSHLPSKFQKLRWCITENSYFIFEMLKMFEPPLDMSQDVDIRENQHLDDVSGSHHFSRSRNLCLCESTSTSGGVDCHCLAEPSSKETCNGKYPAPFNKEQEVDDCKSLPNQDTLYASACCNGKVSSSPPEWLDPSLQLHVPLVDVDKVRCIIRNIVRDWANEGQKERDQCYRPILEELERLFPNRSNENPPACLVPGAGLGRLALEISCLGFASQGNEFSYYMMICSSFILNHTQAAGEWTIFPWIHSNCNSVSDNDQLRPVSVPDIHPARKRSVLVILEAAFNAGWDSLDDKVGRFLNSQGPPINAVGLRLSLTMNDFPYTESLTSLKWSNQEVIDGKTLMRGEPIPMNTLEISILSAIRRSSSSSKLMA